jgi:MFS family permease
MLSMGFVNSWSGLMAARWFLGMTEAGLFPGVNYYLSCWYKRSEFGIRAVSQCLRLDSFPNFFPNGEISRLFSFLPRLFPAPSAVSLLPALRAWTVLAG